MGTREVPEEASSYVVSESELCDCIERRQAQPQRARCPWFSDKSACFERGCECRSQGEARTASTIEHDIWSNEKILELSEGALQPFHRSQARCGHLQILWDRHHSTEQCHWTLLVPLRGHGSRSGKQLAL